MTLYVARTYNNKQTLTGLSISHECGELVDKNQPKEGTQWRLKDVHCQRGEQLHVLPAVDTRHGAHFWAGSRGLIPTPADFIAPAS